MASEPNVQPSNLWATYRRLLRYVRPHWKVMALAVLCMAVYAATDTAFAALMKPMLDGSFVKKDLGTIAWIPWAIIGLFAIRGVTGFLSTYGVAWVGRELIATLRREMFVHMLRLPVPYFDHHSSGQLVTRLTYNVEQVAQAATEAVMILVRDTLTIIGLLCWMFYLNWRLSLILLLVGPALALLVTRVNRRIRLITRKIQISMGEVTEVASETISGQRLVKICGAQGHETARFDIINKRQARQFMKRVAISASNIPLAQLIAAIALAGIVYLATLPEMLATVTVGGFMSFIAALMMLMAPLKRLTSINIQIQAGIIAAHTVFEFLDEQSELDRGTRHLERARGEIEFREVCFAYDPAKGAVLENLNLKISAGQTVALVGRSGSGKSTTVSLLPRFYEPQAGQIFLDGIDVREFRLNDLRAQIAWVGQDVVLFNDTVANNIAYGRAGQVSEEQIIRAATAAHAMEFITRLPQGLQTQIGEKGVLLSGGQRQRLAIARALLKDAPLLVLDEATSALDGESERYIQAALAQLVKNRTTLVIAHRLSTIEQADKIVVMEQGRIVEQGRHAELLARQGPYAALYRMQFSTDHHSFHGVNHAVPLTTEM